jgi:hypothetical protein
MEADRDRRAALATIASGRPRSSSSSSTSRSSTGRVRAAVAAGRQRLGGVRLREGISARPRLPRAVFAEIANGERARSCCRAQLSSCRSWRRPHTGGRDGSCRGRIGSARPPLADRRAADRALDLAPARVGSGTTGRRLRRAGTRAFRARAAALPAQGGGLSTAPRRERLANRQRPPRLSGRRIDTSGKAGRSRSGSVMASATQNGTKRRTDLTSAAGGRRAGHRAREAGRGWTAHARDLVVGNRRRAQQPLVPSTV